MKAETIQGRELVDAVHKATQKLQDTVDSICGACEYSCCETGTMVGSHGLRRLSKGLRLDPQLSDRLRQGLRQLRVLIPTPCSKRILQPVYVMFR
jgi:hypothetical protein